MDHVVDWLLIGIKAGGLELVDFVGVKVMGAFFPAFFIAGAMATLVSKQMLTKYLSPAHGVVRSYFFATTSGAFLTVCSCSVLPLFSALVGRGIGAGPAFTFLAATPAINPIALSYTFSVFENKWIAFGMLLAAALSANTMGLFMARFFPLPTEEKPEPEVLSLSVKKRRPIDTLALFALLTGMVFILPWEGVSRTVKLLWVVGCLIALRLLVRTRLTADEVEAWIDKSLDLMKKILPTIFIAIFLSGAIKAWLDPDGLLVRFMRNPGYINCLAFTVLGSVTYTGSIATVSLVKGLTDMGLAPGAALAFLITGPGVSLATLFGVMTDVGPRRAWAYYIGVMVVTSIYCWLIGPWIR